MPRKSTAIKRLIPVLLWIAPRIAIAQEQPSLQSILERLDRLEQQNRELVSEIRGLRAELAGQTPAKKEVAEIRSTEAPPLEESVAVHERKIDDLAQTKVEAGQKFPLGLTGMLLFNSFLNGRASGGTQFPLTAAQADTQPNNGGSVRQTIIGLTFHGPEVWRGGKVSGLMNMDFWGGRGNLNQTFRMRVATVDVDWKNTSIHAGVDKPIVAPRDPFSLAQVNYSPLTSAGNLWLWQPQIRVEQRIALGVQSGIKARVGVYQTEEPAGSATPQYASTLASSSPAVEGRFEFWGNLGSKARLEIAPGFHVSNTHVQDQSIGSRLFTLDWLVRPWPKWELTGTFFQGQNAAGLGGLPQGFTLNSKKVFIPIHATGGWAQLAFAQTSRFTWRAFAGQESNRAADLLTGKIQRNLTYGANATYQVRSNVLLGIETVQIRTLYLARPLRLTNHYDLSLAYLF